MRPGRRRQSAGLTRPASLKLGSEGSLAGSAAMEDANYQPLKSQSGQVREFLVPMSVTAVTGRL